MEIKKDLGVQPFKEVVKLLAMLTKVLRPYFFLILGLQIFFQNIKVGGGKKKKNY